MVSAIRFVETRRCHALDACGLGEIRADLAGNVGEMGPGDRDAFLGMHARHGDLGDGDHRDRREEKGHQQTHDQRRDDRVLDLDERDHFASVAPRWKWLIGFVIRR